MAALAWPAGQTGRFGAVVHPTDVMAAPVAAIHGRHLLRMRCSYVYLMTNWDDLYETLI